jgi:hypothetical protein
MNQNHRPGSVTHTIPSNGDQLSIPSPTFNLMRIAQHFLVQAHRFVHVDPGQAPLQIASPKNHEHKRARENWARVLAEPGYLHMVVWIRYTAVLAVMTLCLPAGIGALSTRNS